MSTLDNYFATLAPNQKAEFERIRAFVATIVPPEEDGMSYGMPAIMYRGWPVISLMANKNFLSLYPFSGKVFAKLEQELKSFEMTPGSLHFSLEKPIPDTLLREIIQLRMEEIEAKKPKVI